MTPPAPLPSARVALFPADAADPAEPWGYASSGAAYDEFVDPLGQLRPGWSETVRELERLGPDGLGRRWARGLAELEENGVTYNVYGDPRGMHRPWALDPLPLVLGADEWAGIEAGAKQRARLLDAILDDLYGPRDLLASGDLPASLAFAHPGYLRPCCGWTPAGGRRLLLTAMDLARSPDGRWWVLADRTQAPSGAGYCLENRLVVSRRLPDAFRAARIERLARFFDTLLRSVRAVCPRGEAARIVLLTPGPYNETYFEHAYMARYLGVTLAEGADLTVRHGGVYLKTLGGLEPVDAVLRRLDDDYCDPLELRGESAIGVPGLVRAARSGRVVLANALGAGVVESPAWSPFLPGLCRRVLGQELRLPSIATWWCGQPDAFAHVRDHLTDLVIKPAMPGRADAQPIFGDQLSQDQRDELLTRIAEHPEAYLAQESVDLSTAPCWNGRSLDRRHLILRIFVAAAPDGGYTVLPGGLTRVSSSPESRVTSMQRGGGSKDTWVRSEGPVAPFSLLRSADGDQAVARGADLPSRVADNLYWLGRYVDRAEAVVRLLRAIAARLSDDAPGWGQSPEALPDLMSALHAVAPGPEKGENDADDPWTLAEAVLQQRVFDPGQAGSLAGITGNAYGLASRVRDRISTDTWRIISQLESTFEHARQGGDTADAVALLDRVVLTLAAFAGLNHESMTRNQGWRFLDLGRRIERVLGLSRVLRAVLALGEARAAAGLEAVLEVADSTMTYRDRYQAAAAASGVLDLLVFDESNPRSIAFNLVQIEAHLTALPGSDRPGARAEDHRLSIGMLAAVRLADPSVLSRADGPRGERKSLDVFLDGLIAQAPALSDALTRRFLSHTQSPRTLGVEQALDTPDDLADAAPDDVAHDADGGAP
ncbi:MAG: circularly permuted type 2 ATP-grasp protein [Planctomycetota bacterium]